MEFAFTRMSSKGQIVIPAKMRRDIEEGETLLLMKEGVQFILKTATQVEKNFEDDIVFSKRINAAWKQYDKGKFKSLPANKFMELLEKC